MLRVVACLLLSSLSLLAAPCGAGTIRHDVDDSLYLSLAQEPRYDSAGRVFTDTATGSGTLIADNWVLTAAHVAAGASANATSVLLGGSTYNVAEIVSYSGFTGDLKVGKDLSLLRLDGPAGVEATPIFRSTDEDGLTTTILGYGRTGTGLTGATLPSGDKRAGQNLIGGYGSIIDYADTLMLADFDVPDDAATGKAICLPLEYLAAPGDSGGGWYVDVDTTTYLAGVTSFLYALDGETDSTYTDIMGATRVSLYTNWIDAMTIVVPGDANGDQAVTIGDLGVLAANFGLATDALQWDADFNADGVVTIGDLGILAANFGAEAPAHTPEPGIILLLAAALPMLRPRRQP